MSEFFPRAAAVAAALLVLSSNAARAQAPAPAVPADVAAILHEHLGKWRSEGTITINGVTQSAKASWECSAAVDGPGVICTWTHEWPGGVTDRAVDLFGYDAAQNAMGGTRVTDRGIVTRSTTAIEGNRMIARWEAVQDGKPLVGFNEILVTPGGDWSQHMAVDVGGQRVTEMKMTHHRLSGPGASR
jgi:hypothetical protein